MSPEETIKGLSARCARCGRRLDPEDVFCGHCGKRVREPAASDDHTLEPMKLTDVLMGLGIVCLRKGDYFKAVEKFEKIIAADPGNHKARELLFRARRAVRDITGDSR